MLVGGYDPVDKKAELFYMDHLAASIPVNYYAFGYGGWFTLSVMDRHYRPGMDRHYGPGKDFLALTFMK